MDPVPEIMPISDLRLHQSEVLEKLPAGQPVILTQYGRAVAVMVGPDLWNRLLEQLEDLHDAVDVLQARLNPEPTIDTE